MKNISCLALTIALVLIARTAGQGAKTELEQLNGKWSVTSLVRDGKADDSMVAAVRVNAGDKYTLTPKAGKALGGTFTIDATKTPKTMDMKPAEGRYKGQTLLGIYVIEGDTLKVCFAEPGKNRPTEFASKEGSGIVLAIHKREK